jgi:hypothetical protein
MLRLPVYFEDDTFFGGPSSLSLAGIRRTLFTPGLKIFNFHPTFVGCNTPSQEHYEAHRQQIFGGGPPLDPFPGRGTVHVFRELVEAIHERGYRFQRFHDVVELARRLAGEAADLAPGEREA